MFRAVRRIISHLDGLVRLDLREGDDRTEIILYNLLMIGEDANNVSAETCCIYPDVDFKGWAGLRHRLVHDYANIDFDIVWNALRDDLPQLVESLTRIVSSFPLQDDLPSNIADFE